GGRRSDRKLFRARCSACHDPSRVFHRRASLDEWREIVERMRRMPQSGISPAEAKRIVAYLRSLRPRRPVGSKGGRRVGGRKAYGPEWLSILETATVRDGRVRLGGRIYTVRIRAGEVRLHDAPKSRTWVVSLTPEGRPGRTARIERWQVGAKTYEVHLVLYERRGETVRLGRALRVKSSAPPPARR
ncbi:MAG: c-type cytochrome, partial [Planctomycetota bacterium]